MKYGGCQELFARWDRNFFKIFCGFPLSHSGWGRAVKLAVFKFGSAEKFLLDSLSGSGYNTYDHHAEGWERWFPGRSVIRVSLLLVCCRMAL
jgi:hypothetical protein